MENDSIYNWNVCFEGPTNSLYEVNCSTITFSRTQLYITPRQGGIFNCSLEFPDNFPELPPKMKFKTEMWHPNSKHGTRNTLLTLLSVGISLPRRLGLYFYIASARGRQIQLSRISNREVSTFFELQLYRYN